MNKALDSHELARLAQLISPKVARELMRGTYMVVPCFPVFYSFPHSTRGKKTCADMVKNIRRRYRVNSITEELILQLDDNERIGRHRLVLCQSNDLGLRFGASNVQVTEAAQKRQLKLLPAKIAPILQEHLAMARDVWTKEPCIHVMSTPVNYVKADFIFTVGQSGINVVASSKQTFIGPNQKLLFAAA